MQSQFLDVRPDITTERHNQPPSLYTLASSVPDQRPILVDQFLSNSLTVTVGIRQDLCTTETNMYRITVLRIMC